jgi:hypothetical protein
LARNTDRTGAQNIHAEAPPPPVVQNDDSPGFSFVVPTEFVDLPSRGRYYPENHPLHGESSIEVKQMTAKEEDILTSRSLLKKGVALDRLIKSIIVDKRINAESLLVGDRNAIIIAARRSGYGNLYETKVTCPACSTQQDYTFDLNEAEVYEGKALEELGVVSNDDNTFDVVLPQTSITVTFKVLTGYDEKTLVNGVEHDRRKKGVEQNVTRQLTHIICAANGDRSPQTIKYLVENIPSIDARHLRMVYRHATPNIDLEQHFMCNECEYEHSMEVPLTADFFWPDR